MPQTPNTVIEFYNVPWDAGYRNLRYFGSEGARDSWFSGRSHITYPDDFSESVTHAQPVKEGVPYTVRGTWDRLHNYNYIRYKNNSYASGEWQYAFITGWSWSSEHSATFGFIRDIWINNVDKFTFPEMYIERETTNTVNDLPEPISVNRYVGEEKHTIHDGSHPVEALLYVILCSGGSSASDHDSYTCSICGLQYPFRMGTFDDPSLLKVWIDTYTVSGTADRIVTCFAVPRCLFDVGENSIIGKTIIKRCDRDSIGYTPKHSKCLRYPYTYIEVGDWFGNKQIYKWENGYGDENGQHFEVNQLSVCGMSSFLTLCPSDVNNQSKNEGEQSISHSIHGQIGWTVDGMSQWIAQNTSQIKAQQEQMILSTGSKLVSGAVSAGVAGAMTGGVGAVPAVGGTLLSVGLDVANFNISQSAMMDRADFTPNSVGMPDGAVLGLLSQGRALFYYRTVHMSVSEMRALDDFFTRYGYCVNRYGSLNLSHSPYYFVKTNGACVRGACPQSDRDMMMAVLDRGVTFWSKDAIGDYE